MKNLGLIVEYNPFHNGHSYHISESQKITKADNTIAIMSGNFVQRGEAAFLINGNVLKWLYYQELTWF